MKPQLNLLAAALMFGACAGGAYAAYIPPVTTDTLLFSEETGNSGDDTEKQLLVDYLNGLDPDTSDDITLDDLVLVDKQTTNAGVIDFINNPDPTADQYVIDVSPEATDFFLLKFGIGPGNDDTFYFSNLVESSLLVWENSQVNGLMNNCTPVEGSCTDTRLSHYTLLQPNGGEEPPTGAPEPGVLFLMGAGLLGLGMARRRKSA